MTKEEKIEALKAYFDDFIIMAKNGTITIHEIEVNRETESKLIDFYLEQIPTGRETLRIDYHVKR